MKVVDHKGGKLMPLYERSIGEAFLLDGTVCIKTDEKLDDNAKQICMDTDGVLFHFDVSSIVTPLKATLVIGDYNEEE